MKVPLYAEAQEEILGLSRCPQGANTGLWYNKMCNKWKDTQANDISDDDFRIAVNNALCDILGVDEPDLL
jgi:hypothetical protein